MASGELTWWWLAVAVLAAALAALLLRLWRARRAEKVEKFGEGGFDESALFPVDRPFRVGTGGGGEDVPTTWDADPEGVMRPTPGTIELTAAGQVFSDPLRCSLLPGGQLFSFHSEGVVSHPRSTPEAPKCILTRDGMGLLANDDPLSCVPVSDEPWFRWQNPLNQAGNGGAIASVYSDHVGGLDRCTVSFNPAATADDLRAVDRAMAMAGAEVRSGFPDVLRELELTNASLESTTASLVTAYGRLNADAARMNDDARVLAVCQKDVQDGETQLEALATNSEQTMAAAVADFETQYKALRDGAQTQLNSRISRDQTQLDGAVKAQKVIDDADCDKRKAALQLLAKTTTASARPPALNVKIQAPTKGKSTMQWKSSIDLSVAGYDRKAVDLKDYITGSVPELSVTLKNPQYNWNCTVGGTDIINVLAQNRVLAYDVQFTASAPGYDDLPGVVHVSESSIDVILYTKANYQGTGVPVKNGEYDDRRNNLPIPNDSLESIRIPSGKKVLLYEDNFGGYSLVVKKDIPSLSAVTTNRSSGNWGKCVSSMVVKDSNDMSGGW